VSGSLECSRRVEGLLRRLERETSGLDVERPSLKVIEPGEVWWQDWGDAWPLLALYQLTGGSLSIPSAIIKPRDAESVAMTLKLASEVGVCIVPRGGGSGVLGGVAARSCCVILDLSSLSWVRVRVEDSIVEAGAGALLERVEEEAKSKGLTIGYYPQSLGVATVGGAIASLGSGALQPGYGNIEDVVEYIDVATVEGEILRLGAGPRGRLGPGLKDLIIGSEGTLGVIVSAGLRARALPEAIKRAVVRFKSFSQGLKAARKLVQWNQPQILRLIDGDEASLLYGREGAHLLIAYMDIDSQTAEELTRRAVRVAVLEGGEDVGEDLFDEWWKERFSYGRRVRELWGAGLWFDTIDVMSWWSSLPEANEKLKEALRRYSLAVFSHASHFYPTGGALYVTFVVEARVDKLARAWHEALKELSRLGITPTHHHGIGVQKLLALTGSCPDWYVTYCKLAYVLDPKGVLNPYGLKAGCRKCLKE